MMFFQRGLRYAVFRRMGGNAGIGVVFHTDAAGVRADGGRNALQELFGSLLQGIRLMQVSYGPVQQGQVVVLFFKAAGLLGNLSFQIIV